MEARRASPSRHPPVEAPFTEVCPRPGVCRAHRERRVTNTGFARSHRLGNLALRAPCLDELLQASFQNSSLRLASKKKRPGFARPFLRVDGWLVAYWMTISTRRFCGSRTPSAVGTSRPCSPRPMTVIAGAGTPSRTNASLTALARRSDSAML